jgi:hypothetical protein
MRAKSLPDANANAMPHVPQMTMSQAVVISEMSAFVQYSW